MFDKVFAGTVVLPDRVIDDGHVLVADGLVQFVGSGRAPAGEKHGGPGFLVLPGAIDAQVHSRSQKGQEDFIWSTRSAASGGVTTIVDMPYDDGCLIASADRLREKVTAATVAGACRFRALCDSRSTGRRRQNRRTGRRRRAAFKFSTFGTHPTRFPRVPPQTLYACFSRIGRRGLVAGIHNENDEMVRAFIAEVEKRGVTDYRAHGLSRPPITEAVADAEVFELAAGAGCPVHIVHSSIARGYELAAAYRAQGYAATIEACIHYLTLDEENDVRRLGGKAKINPPLRSRGEVEAHLAASRCRQRHGGVDRSRELVGGPQVRSEHAQERLWHSRARGSLSSFDEGLERAQPAIDARRAAFSA